MAEKCINCETRISRDDAISVCPKCESKYHRWCWNTSSYCKVCGYFIEENLKNEEEKAKKEYEEHHQEEKQNAGVNYLQESINNQLNNEETGLFANIGEKIKTWAKRTFVIGVIFGNITFIVIAIESDWDMFFVALGAGIGVVLTAWTTALLLYAFGELVSNSKESKELQKEILKELKNKKE